MWYHYVLILPCNVISDMASTVTHTTSNSVFLNQAVNKPLWKCWVPWRRWQNGGGLTGALVRIQTANVSGYMLVNTPVNHSVNEGSGCASISLSALSWLTHPWRGDAWRSRWQPIWWLSLAWLVSSSPLLLRGWKGQRPRKRERHKEKKKMEESETVRPSMVEVFLSDNCLSDIDASIWSL